MFKVQSSLFLFLGVLDVQTTFYAIASAAVVVITVIVIFVARALLREMHKVGRVSDEMSDLMRKVNDEVLPVTKNVSTALGDIDNLVVQVTKTAERIDRVAGGAERLLDTAHVASAATKAASSAAAEVISVYEGVKRGIKTLRGS
jgi:methyl-accepting chemotaxis protein